MRTMPSSTPSVSLAGFRRSWLLAGVISSSVALAIAPDMHADATWVPTAAGTYHYNDGLNWAPAVPPNAGASAFFGSISGDQAINVNLLVSLGSISFNDSNNDYVLNLAGGSLVLSGSNPFVRNSNSGSVRIINGSLDLSTGAEFVTTLASTNLYVDSPISGAGGLTKTGPGELFLKGNHTYEGPTTISGGTLYLGYTTFSVGVPIYHSASLDPDNTIVNNGALRFNGGNPVIQGVDFGIISGSGDVVVQSSAVTLSGNNSYHGKTSVTANATTSGSLSFDSITHVGSVSALGSPDSVSNGTIDLAPSNTSSVTLEYTGNGDVTNRVINLSGNSSGIVSLQHTGTGLLKFTSDFTSTGINGKTLGLHVVSGATGEIAGAIVNNSSSHKTAVTKSGSGTWILSGANTYTGATTINSGTLWIRGSISNASTIVNNGTLVFESSGAVMQGLDFSSNISGSGTLRNAGTGQLVLTGTNTYTGAINVAAGSMKFGTQTSLYNNNSANWTASKITVESGAMLALNVGGTGEFTSANVDTLKGIGTAGGGFKNGSFLGLDTTNAAGGTFTYGSVIANTNSGANAVGLTKLGANTLALTVGNTYTGATNVSAGTLEITTNDSLGTNAAGTSVASGAALRLNGVNYTTAEALSINGTGVSGGGALVNSGTSTYAGQVTAATNATINAGGGTLTLTGGLVKNGTVLTVAGGGSVIVNGTGISGASASSDLVVDGTTLVVNASSDYNGPTTVQNSGTLVANAAVITTQMTVDITSTLGGTGSVTVAEDGFMFINGLIHVGDPTVGAPVASDLDLITSGSGGTILGAGSQVTFDLFTGAGLGTIGVSDLINLYGLLDATLGGTLVLDNPNAMAGFAAGDMWKIFDLQNGSITGTLALDHSALNLDGNLTGFFDQNTGVFSIVVLPEPGRALLLMFGLSGIMLRRRRCI